MDINKSAFMMEDYLHVYDSAGNPDQKSKDNLKSSPDGKKYMVPLKPRQEKKSEYEQPQVSVLSLPKMKLPESVYESTTTQHQNNDRTELNEGIQKKKKPVWFIAICVFTTVFAVVTLVALAIGALSYNSIQQGSISGTISEELLNY